MSDVSKLSRKLMSGINLMYTHRRISQQPDESQGHMGTHYG